MECGLKSSWKHLTEWGRNGEGESKNSGGWGRGWERRNHLPYLCAVFLPTSLWAVLQSERRNRLWNIKPSQYTYMSLIFAETTLGNQNLRYVITWLHTRAFKYNVSVLVTCLECEGVKCTYFNFTWWQWKRSLFKNVEIRRQVWSTPHLRTHLTNRNWKPSESDLCTMYTCSCSKILNERTDKHPCLC